MNHVFFFFFPADKLLREEDERGGEPLDEKGFKKCVYPLEGMYNIWAHIQTNSKGCLRDRETETLT